MGNKTKQKLLVTQEALIIALVENKELREALLLSAKKPDSRAYSKLMEEISAAKTKNKNLENSVDIRDVTLDESTSQNEKDAQEIAELKSQLESLTKQNALQGHNLQYSADTHRALEADMRGEIESLQKKVGTLTTEAAFLRRTEHLRADCGQYR